MRSKVFLAVITAFLVSIALPILGQLKLKDVPPGEPADHTLNKRFSLENSLRRIKQISGALESFRVLTEKTRGKLSKEEISKIENTDWETQNLGFGNWIGAVEGTLRKQDYQIKKLKFELAKEKYEAGKVKKEELQEKEMCYKKAESEFQKFWDSSQIAD